MARKKKPHDPFRWFDSSPEVIRLVVMWYVRYPLSLRNTEDMAFERGINICHETVRKWVDRFGPMFASEIRRRRVDHMRQFTHWKWHLDEVYVKINGEMQEGAKAPRPYKGHRNRSASFLRRRLEGDRRC
jgi:putative transposase